MPKRLPRTESDSEGFTSLQKLLGETTVVIPVRDDPELKKCLASIDEDIKIHVVCNGSSDAYVSWVADIAGPRVTILRRQSPGIGAAYNLGIESAATRFVLLMDSDCVFSAGTIRRIVEGLISSPMSKGRVQFRSDGRLSTRLTARAREVLEDRGSQVS